jgi:transcriptional regulator GlxA family with amidase domain
MRASVPNFGSACRTATSLHAASRARTFRAPCSPRSIAVKRSTGITPHQYLIQQRVERAREMLTHTNLSLSEVAYAVGFSDQSHLAHHFRQAFGITPGRFRWWQN